MVGVSEVWELITVRAGSAEEASAHARLDSRRRCLPWGCSCVPGQFAAFRRVVGSFFKASIRRVSSRGGRADPLDRLSPLLQRILHSRLVYGSLFRFLVKPRFGPALIWCFLPGRVTGGITRARRARRSFLAVNLLLNSRIGRTAEEVVVDESCRAGGASACG